MEGDLNGLVNVTNWYLSLSEQEKETALLEILHTTSPSVLSKVHAVIGRLLKVDFVSELPEEVTLKILSHLSAEDICMVEATCRSWRRFIKQHSPELWGPLYRRKGWDPQFHAFRPLDDKDFYTYKLEIESNWTSGKYLTRKLRGHSRAVFYVQLEDTVLYSGSFDNTIKVWNLASGSCLKSIVAHDSGVSCLRCEHDIIVSGSSDNTLKIWPKDLSKCLHTLRGHSAEVTSLYHNGKTVVSGSCDNTIRKWDVQTGTLLNTLYGHSDYVISLMFDAKIIVSGSYDKTVKIWDFDTGANIKTLNGHAGGIKCIKFDRKYIVSASEDRTVRVWDRGTCECLAVLRGHTKEVWCVQMLYTGMGDNSKVNRIISGGRDGIRVWEVNDDLQLFRSSKVHIPTEGTITCIDLNPSTIACSSFDKSITLYEFEKKWELRSTTHDRRPSMVKRDALTIN
eukprot:CFRG0848T1